MGETVVGVRQNEIGDLLYQEWVRLTNLPTGRTFFLTKVRHRWNFHPMNEVFIDCNPCFKYRLIESNPDAVRRGLKSKAVEMYKDPKFLIDIVGTTYEWGVCNCSPCKFSLMTDPVWLFKSEKVVKRIYPEPTVLDRLADI